MQDIGYIALGIATSVIFVSIFLAFKDAFKEIQVAAKSDAKHAKRRKLRQSQACRSDWFPE